MKSHLKAACALSALLAASLSSQALAQGRTERVTRGGAAAEEVIRRDGPREFQIVEPQDSERRAGRDRISDVFGGAEVGPLDPTQPLGPEIDYGVYEPGDFTISGYSRDEVGLRWWNHGGPQTKVFRRINGGSWELLQTYGALPTGAYVDFVDQNATVDAENCYYVSVSDGVNNFSAKTTPWRCAFTRDGRRYSAHRVQLRLTVGDVSDAGTDESIEVRLQPSSYVTAVTNWSPRGNSTWVDSTADDFERGSSLTYDLLLSNVRDVSDITQVTLVKPGDDEVCIAGVELLVNGDLAYAQSYSPCRWIGGDELLSVPFEDLRASQSWRQLGDTIFSGYDGAALRSIIQAQFGHFLHGYGELRNGRSISTSRADERRLHVSVPVTVYDVPILGEVDSTIHFDLAFKDENGATRLAVENVDADSSDLLGYFLPAIGWGILYGTSSTIEAQLEALRPVRVPGSPIQDTHPCFTAEGGISVCYD